jgi:hypothetical protein
MFVLLALAGPARAVQPRPQATVVMVADGGGLDPATLRTLRSLVAVELRKRGHQVNEDPRLEGIHPAGPESLALAGELGNRAFALRVAGRLGSKVPLALEEVDPEGVTVASASLTAGSIEECDLVVPRLVEAVLGHRPAESTARLATVTSTEGRPYQKKPGERFWVFGLPMPLFSGDGSGSQNGFSLGYMYEAEHFGVGFQAMSARNKDTHFGFVSLDTFWLPLAGEVSPYAGFGLGYLNTEMASGMGLKLTGGVELFRLHAMRVKAGLDLILPFYDNSQVETRLVGTYPTWTFTTAKVKGPSTYGVFHLQVAF